MIFRPLKKKAQESVRLGLEGVNLVSFVPKLAFVAYLPDVADQLEKLGQLDAVELVEGLGKFQWLAQASFVIVPLDGKLFAFIGDILAWPARLRHNGGLYHYTGTVATWKLHPNDQSMP